MVITSLTAVITAAVITRRGVGGRDDRVAQVYEQGFRDSSGDCQTMRLPVAQDSQSCFGAEVPGLLSGRAGTGVCNRTGGLVEELLCFLYVRVRVTEFIDSFCGAAGSTGTVIIFGGVIFLSTSLVITSLTAVITASVITRRGDGVTEVCKQGFGDGGGYREGVCSLVADNGCTGFRTEVPGLLSGRAGTGVCNRTGGWLRSCCASCMAEWKSPNW